VRRSLREGRDVAWRGVLIAGDQVTLNLLKRKAAKSARSM
jgi:hypothetical protein